MIEYNTGIKYSITCIKIQIYFSVYFPVPATLFSAIGIAVKDQEGELYLTWKENKHIYIVGELRV